MSEILLDMFDPNKIIEHMDNTTSSLTFSSKCIITFAKDAVIAAEKNNGRRPFEETVKDNCEVEPIFNSIITTNTTPSLTLTIKAFHSKHRDLIYWYVGCDLDSALRAVGGRSFRDFEYDEESDSYNEIEKRHHDSYFWGRVADNELVRTMLKFLCMSDTELELHCGRNHPLEYRFALIKNLDNLWD